MARAIQELVADSVPIDNAVGGLRKKALWKGGAFLETADGVKHHFDGGVILFDGNAADNNSKLLFRLRCRHCLLLKRLLFLKLLSLLR